jgi:K+ transporter
MAKRTAKDIERAMATLKTAGYKVMPEEKQFVIKTFEVEAETLKLFLALRETREQKLKDAVTEAIQLYLLKYSATK